VFDDGDGMALDGLVQARQFGLSTKSLSQHVGFRGIGIYSSFHLCIQLRVTCKKAGEKY
jgi:Histidine kinase-, DNA gyrase B-, and HSP90-like ATPase